MLGLLGMGISPIDSYNMEKRLEAERERRFEEVYVPSASPWDPNLKREDLREWAVCFKAETYNPPKLFDSAPVERSAFLQPDDVLGPVWEGRDGRPTCWYYRNTILPRGKSLSIMFGASKGWVYFDGDVVVPTLLESTLGRPKVWMSMTPFEMFTQRPGIRHCRGNVCIGGYGMGWFLEEVARKKYVNKITVVERSRELLEWFGFDRIKALAAETGKPIEVVVGDVYPYLKEHHAEFDKIALDTFLTYGNNNMRMSLAVYDLLHVGGTLALRFDKKKLWCWGGVNL